ncbi:MAG: c-type cytochrome biogenesis protein CcmI [Pseudohongiellaceae bacterium]
MNGIYLPMLLLSLLAMAFVLLPLRRQRVAGAAVQKLQRAAKNREVFEQRVAELAREVQDGVIAAEDHERMLSELQRTFLADMQALDIAEAQPRVSRTSATWVGWALALVVPLLDLGVYRQQGSAEDLQLPTLVAAVGAAADESAQRTALDDLTSFLQQRFVRRPEDLQNGYMLGTLLLSLERYPEAIATFEQMLAAMEPTPDRATVLGQLAQARYLAADSVITPEVKAVMDAALVLNPNEQAVMSLSAIDAFLRQDFPAALQFWRRQLADLTPGSADAEELRQRIAMVEASLPPEQAAVAAGPSIEVVVDVAPELLARVTPDMRLFVFARSPAMPMPIVAQNLAVPAFPFTLKLDNSMSMAGAQLEQVPELVIGARLSVSGQAIGQSGDLESLSAPFTLAAQPGPIALTIDTVRP